MRPGPSFGWVVLLLLALGVGGGSIGWMAAADDGAGKTVLDHQLTSVGERPGGCDEFGCGTNHNETLLRDGEPELEATRWGRWLSRLLSSLGSAADGKRWGGCEEFGCGSNHNEALLADSARR